MGLIHQTNAGFVGDRGINQSPSGKPRHHAELLPAWR